MDRIEGRVDAKKTVVGYTAYSKDIDIEGLDTDPKDVKAALTAPADKWQMDLSDTEDWLKSLGPKVPQEIWDEFDFLKTRIKTANKDGNKALDDMKTPVICHYTMGCHKLATRRRHMKSRTPCLYHVRSSTGRRH